MCCLFKLIWGSFDCNGNSSLRHLRAASTLLLWLTGCKFVKLFMLLEHIKLVCRKLFIDLPQFVAVWEKVERERGRKAAIKINSICSFPFAVRQFRLFTFELVSEYICSSNCYKRYHVPFSLPLLCLNLTRTFHKSFESKYLHNIFDFILWSKQRDTGKRTIVACFCISVCVCVYLQLLQQINML